MSEHEQAHAAEDEAQAVDAAPATIGRVLRQARESRGESMSDAAYALKLMPRQIEAMESGRFDLLPGPAFVRGFLRNYARYLGVDIEHMLAALGGPASSQVNLSPVTNAQGAMPAAGGELRLLKPVLVAVAAMVVMLAAGWYFDWFRVGDVGPAPQVAEAPLEPAGVASLPPAAGNAPVLPGASPWQPEPLPVDPVEEPGAIAFARDGETPPVDAPEAEADTDAAGGEELDAADVEAAANEPVVDDVAPAPAEGLSRLVFRVEGESWIQVRDASGATIFTGTEQPGTTRSVDGQAPLSIVVGNAARVSLEHDGVTVDLAPHTRSSGVARLELQ